MLWRGACKDGYADGAGVLTWRSQDGERKIEATLARGEISGEGRLTRNDGTYNGTFRHGLPHGQGYFRYANDNSLYEGDFADGIREGTGVFLAPDRSRYDGQWRNDRRNGFGKQVYSVGGSYEGMWKDNRFEGKGVIVYAGSGRRYEGEFRDGRVAGAPPRGEIEHRRYVLKADLPRTGTAILADKVVGYGPLNATWEELTPEQKNRIRSLYPALEDGDEPPYPLHGTRRIYSDIADLRDAKFRLMRGKLGLYVLVGKNGKPKSVAAYGSPDPDFPRYASMALLLHTFKPAQCHGEPCEMIYPIWFNFTRN
ncbi:hypothetical protein GCM10027320_01430 [Massilia solisilvae]